MITPELITYIRGEFAKGKTREEIHVELVKGGGWSEVDLNEAFRAVIPMQGATQKAEFAQGAKLFTPSTGPAKTSPSFWKFFLIFAVLGALGLVIWFFRGSLVNSLNFLPFIGGSTIPTSPQAVVPNDAVVTPVAQVKDCGISTTPNLRNPATYESDGVLACLGNSARLCENARAILTDDLFPTIFQILKNQDTCTFRLSYESNSTLLDINGTPLARQYISCPINIVKAIDESNPKSITFNPPSTENLGKYASEIYFYGTIGLFMENDVDRNRIQALGCSGEYINSVIASYNNI
ncbi:MAG: hypothetical protein WD963_00410 [Candidatus Paceibacterota bacterium]